MYIKDVIEKCDLLYPNSYTLEEKYFWCDELSEILTIKYNTRYVKSELSECGGSYILPENITSSMLCCLILQDEVIKKQDFARFGILCFDKDARAEIVLPASKVFSRVYAVYIQGYEKIRNINEELTVTFEDGAFICDKELFKEGDILDITIGEESFSDIYVLGVNHDEDTGKTRVLISSGDIPRGEKKAKIFRRVTEQTVCPPPFDSMYIDYVLGKICYYQNDFSACNNHMTLYNLKLLEYEKWLKSHPVIGYKKKKLKNWW